MQFISNIKVVYGDDNAQMPHDRIVELTSLSEDINSGFGGKYVWLVPSFTPHHGEALTRVDIDIQKEENQALNDLAKGAGGDHRYLIQFHSEIEPNKITDVKLLRLTDAMSTRPDGWGGDTGNINKGRGGTYLYLLWKTAA